MDWDYLDEIMEKKNEISGSLVQKEYFG